MNITHISFGFNTGGAELMVSDIMKLQSQQGHNVTLILINNQYEPSLLDNLSKEINIVKVGRPSGSKNPLWYLKYNRKLRATKPDIVHFHQTKASSFTIPAKGTGYVETIHCLGAPVKKHKFINRYVAISTGVNADLAKRMGLSTQIIHNGIKPFEITVRDDASRKEGTKFRIVCVSRLDHMNKGQDIAIDALDIINNAPSGERISLDLIGEGASEKFLRNLISEKGVKGDIRFLGNRSRDYIYRHLADYDLFLQPSRHEGFGLTVAEAMAAKVPVLVSDIDGPMEIIENGGYGTFFKNGDAADCAMKIKEIITDYAHKLRIAENAAYMRVKDRYDIRRTAMEYIGLYNTIISEKRGTQTDNTPIHG